MFHIRMYAYFCWTHSFNIKFLLVQTNYLPHSVTRCKQYRVISNVVHACLYRHTVRRDRQTVSELETTWNCYGLCVYLLISRAVHWTCGTSIPRWQTQGIRLDYREIRSKIIQRTMSFLPWMWAVSVGIWRYWGRWKMIHVDYCLIPPPGDEESLETSGLSVRRAEA